jgi:hypothetical protein
MALISGLTGLVEAITARPAAAAQDTWTQLHPSTSPGIFTAPAMAYDSRTGQLLLTGAAATDTQEETWVWTGINWKQLNPTGSPPPLAGASMAYDATTGDMLLFGGQNLANASAASNQTWLWNGQTWTQYAGSGPPGRAYAAMAYNPGDDNLVLYGGTPDGGTTALNDTWIWDASGWIPVTSDGVITNGIWGAQLGYDSFKNGLVLHGGLSPAAGTVYDYLYLWKSSTSNWVSPFSDGAFCSTCGASYSDLPAIAGNAMAFDASTNQLIEFGGQYAGTTALNSITFDYVADSSVTVTNSPPGRSFSAAAYDGATGQVVMFGGNTGSGYVNETWAYGSPPPPTSCASFTDTFGLDTSLATDPNWQAQTPALAAVASGVGATSVAPTLTFSPSGMDMQSGVTSNQITGIQSLSACGAPFTFETHVTPSAFAGVSFGVDLVSPDLSQALSVEADFGLVGNGIWVGNNLASGFGNGTKLIANPPTAATYDVQISITAAGLATVAVSGYGGSTSTTVSVGKGPFSVLLEQRNASNTAGTNEAIFTDATLSPQPITNTLRLFYAAPDAMGTSVSIGGLVDDPSKPNTTYSLEIDRTGTCNSEGGAYGAPNLSVTSDANGLAYFSDTFPTTFGVPAFLSLSSSAPFEVSNCYPVGPDNTAWENALNIPLVGGVGTTPGDVAVPGESRWYKFQTTPDTKATVTLSGLSDDYAVAVYNDISQADTTTSGGTSSLNNLSAESAADTFSPSAFIPSAFIPSAFIPSAFIPSAFIPSAFIPSAFIPSAFIPSAFIPSNYSPSAFIPSAFIPSAFIPSAFIPSAFIPSAFIPSAFIPSAFIPSAFIPSTYSSAVNRSLLTYNDEGGTGDKTVTVNTWTATGTFYVRVAGHNGASDPNNGFQVSVNVGSGACPAGVVPIGSPPPPVAASGAQTVILTDTSRVTSSPAERADLQTQLQTLASRPEVGGTIVDLAGSSRVHSLDAQSDANPSCPYAKNLVANAIRDVVNSYRVNNPLKYVVIAGPDNVVPFFRHADQTLMGNESGYTPPVADTSASQASLRLSYTLSDNDYGSNTVLQTQTNTFPVPDLAVGRLVETEPEISGQIQAYLANAAGVLPTPTSSLVTGYDFLTLPATSVQNDLAAGTGQTPDTLIAPRTQAPAASWTGTDLKNKVLNSGRHDVVFLAGHFSANDSLAADYTTDMITTDMEQSGVDLKNALVFSAGCHSGYNIVNGDAVPNVTLTLDWPEEFARKQAILIGGTGYQYGDTDFIAYSEQIYAGFAHQLRVGTGPVSIGQALLKAKDDYLTNTPQLGAMNQKAVFEAELYGLPMEAINMPSGRVAAPADTSVVAATTPAATDPGQTLGLNSATVTVTPHLATNTVAVNDLTNSNAPVNTTYLSGDNGIVTNPYQPVLPLESENTSVAGQSLRGAVFLGGTYTDTRGVTPLTGAPATEIRGVHTGFTSSVLFPEKLFSINYFDALDGNGTGATRLMVTPAQHISDPGARTDTRRQYNTMNFQLYYSNNTTTYGSGMSASTPSLSAPPDIVEVRAVPDPDNQHIDVCASVGGAPSAGVQDVFATYTDPTLPSPSWQSIALTQLGCSPGVSNNDPNLSITDSTSWGGQIPLNGSSAGNVKLLLQAVGGSGQVSLDDNLGQYYSTGAPPTSCCSLILSNVQVTSPTTAPYGSSATVSATLNSFNPNGNPGSQIGGPIPGRQVTFTIGNQTAAGTTDANGNAHAIVPLALPPASYQVSAALNNPPDGNIAPAADAAQQITVTPQPTLLTLSTPSVGADTSTTATLCASMSTTACGSTDPPVANRTIVFELSGSVSRITTAQTNSAGQVRYDMYGLPRGSYTLNAYFDGTIPNVGTLTDSFYLNSSASAQFASGSSYPTPPTLSVPANITVTTNTSGAVVSYVASATDPVDPRPQVSCSPGSVTLFPLGTTTVSCKATDTAGNSSAKSFTITVTPPSIPLSAGTTTCNGTYGGTGTDVIVPAGDTCRLVPGTTVSDSIIVQPGGTLNTSGVTVGNSVTLTGAKPSTLCGLTVTHNLSVTGGAAATAVTVIGDTANGCSAGDHIGGSVAIAGNAGPIDFGSSTVGTFGVSGDVSVAGNSGTLTVSGDQIGHDLAVAGNAGAVTVTNSRVGHDLAVAGDTGQVSVTGNQAGHDIVVSSNTAPAVVTANLAGDDLVVQANKPGGVTVTGNVATRNAICSANRPITGSGNVAGNVLTCPA